MRICSQYVGLRKVYEMTEFQSFKISKFERVAPNSFSGLVFYIIPFFFVLIFVLEIPDVISAQETSEDDGLEDVNLYKSGDIGTQGANDYYVAEGIYLID